MSKRVYDLKVCTHPGCTATYQDRKSKKNTLCKRHSSQRAADDPTTKDARRQALLRNLADPHYRAKMGAGRKRYIAERRARDPEFEEYLRRSGDRITGKGYGHRPESRLRAGKTRSARMLAHIPLEYRDEYHRLRESKRLSAAEASRVIRDQIEADAAFHHRTGRLPQAERNKL